MQHSPSVFILWDSSHIWGLMLWRALRTLGIRSRLIKGKEIAEGALLGKPAQMGKRGKGQGRPPLLLVPGGSARLKALALGEAGREAIREYVYEGGNYLGFCGGAGLALSTHPQIESLQLCPWTRAGYSHRLLHLLSGHVRVQVAQDVLAPMCDRNKGLSLPVWWPGRFSASDGDVRVLASCLAPDTDFWLGDLPLGRIPTHVFDAWQDMYGLNLSADFLQKQPLVISGAYGKGQYVLSYSHLETPNSADANAWLAHLLHCLAGIAPKRELVPGWRLDREHCSWPESSQRAPLLEALRRVRALLNLAEEQHIFFQRTPWLWGWRQGLPGATCNNLHVALSVLAGTKPSEMALVYWNNIQDKFTEMSRLFAAGAEDCLLSFRLAETLSSAMPDVVGHQWLDNQRKAIFGHPMQGGGLVEELLETVEELLYLSQ